jgi:hypothetical protein
LSLKPGSANMVDMLARSTLPRPLRANTVVSSLQGTWAGSVGALMCHMWQFVWVFGHM